MKKRVFFFVLFLLLIFAFQNSTEAINSDFFKSFNDKNLEYFIERANEGNLDLKIASINSDIFKQYISYQKAESLPNLSFGLSPAIASQSGAGNFKARYSLPIFASYEADIFLKNKDKTTLAKKDYEMSLLDKEALNILTASFVGTCYFNILKINKLIEIQNELINDKKEIHKLTQNAYKLGQIPSQNVINAYNLYLSSRAEINELEKQKEKLVYNLAVLIGENPNNISDFRFSNLDDIYFGFNIPDLIESTAVIYRPDYKMAELALERAGVDIKIAKKEFLPTINITGISLFNSSNFSSLLSGNSALFSFGASIMQDLFTGGRKLANLKIKKLDYKAKLLEYEKVNLIGIQEINDALFAYRSDNKIYEEYKKQNILQEKDYSLNMGAYELGALSKVELLNAKENLLNQKMLLNTAKAQVLVDNIGLYKALGAKI